MPLLHRLLADRLVGADAAATGPVAHGIGAVAGDQRGWIDRRVALRFVDAAAGWIKPVPRDHQRLPGDRSEVIVRLDDRVERPGADDVVCLRPQLHREQPRVQRRVVDHPCRDLRAERGGCPGVHDIGFGAQLGIAACAGARRRVGQRVDWELRFVGQDRRAAAVAIPDRERDAIETLARDAPIPAQVLDPVLVARLHVGGMPGDAPPGVEPGWFRVEDADEPLIGLEDLKRRAAALVNADRLGSFLGLQQLTGSLQIGDDAFARRAERKPGIRPTLGAQPPLPGDERDQRKLVRPPPRNIGQIAEGATHHRAAALLRIDRRVGQDGNAPMEEWNYSCTPDQVREARVLRMDEDSDTGREQLGACCSDRQELSTRGNRAGGLMACVFGEAEGQRIERCCPLGILHLGLRDRGLAFDAPGVGGLGAIDQPLAIQIDKRPLRDPPGGRIDRRVAQPPIDAHAQALPESFEAILDLARDLQAHGDEARAPDIACADAAAPLDEALGRQAVVVETERIIDIVALHSPEARHRFGLDIGVNVADMDIAGDGRWRGIDREDRAWVVGREFVDPFVRPERLPAALGLGSVVALWKAHRRSSVLLMGAPGIRYEF